MYYKQKMKILYTDYNNITKHVVLQDVMGHAVNKFIKKKDYQGSYGGWRYIGIYLHIIYVWILNARGISSLEFTEIWFFLLCISAETIILQDPCWRVTSMEKIRNAYKVLVGNPK